jgi:hypothetical protein
MSSLFFVIDVAHPPRTAEAVESELVEAWSRVRNSPALRGLKIIHGYGSKGKGGSTRETVRNWAFRNRSKFRAVIEGERFSLFEPEVQALSREFEVFEDPDLGKSNPGVLLIWIK